jgi:hypothetical protein
MEGMITSPFIEGGLRRIEAWEVVRESKSIYAKALLSKFSPHYR